jgi:peroxiredoxin
VKQTVFKVLLVILILGTAVTVAFWGGAETGNFLDRAKYAERHEKHQSMTKAELEQMGTIEIGKQIPDYEFFQNLEGETVRLSTLITTTAWLMFMQPDCDACLNELERMETILTSPNPEYAFVLISVSNPLDLIAIQKKYGLTCPILHDRNATYSDAVKIATFPFNVLVDKELVIQKVIVGELQIE